MRIVLIMWYVVKTMCFFVVKKTGDGRRDIKEKDENTTI